MSVRYQPVPVLQGDALDATDRAILPGLRLLADIAEAVAARQRARAGDGEPPLDNSAAASNVTVLSEIPHSRRSRRAPPAKPAAHPPLDPRGSAPRGEGRAELGRYRARARALPAP